MTLNLQIFIFLLLIIASTADKEITDKNQPNHIIKSARKIIDNKYFGEPEHLKIEDDVLKDILETCDLEGVSTLYW